MSESREKVMQMAEKLVARGKLSQAIKEYRKLLQQNPNDAITLNRIGDLYARQDNVAEAVGLFSQIAEGYSQDGFFVKAIAIYKKIIRLDPTQLNVYGKLAELYHRQGLVIEARSQYQVLADYYLGHGDRPAAVEVHRKMAEIEPLNPTHRVRLAELYLEEELVEEAMGEYQRIAEVMLEHGHVEEAAKVFLRALDVDSSDLTFISEAVIRLREDGQMEVAEQVFEAAVALNPDAAKLDELMRSHQESPSESVATEVPAAPAAPVEAPADLSDQISAEELEQIAASSELPDVERTDDGAFLIDIDAAAGVDLVETPETEGGEIELDLDSLEPLTAVPEELTATSPPAETAAEEALAEPLVSPEVIEEVPGEQPPAEAAASPTVRLSELLAEAEVFSKYGLETKAIRRLERALEIDGSQVEAHRRLLLISLDRADSAQVIRVAERMLTQVPEGTDESFWTEVLGKLSSAGYSIEDGRVLKDATAPVEAPAEAEPAVEDEELGLEWLRSEAAKADRPEILFEAEEEFFDLAAELEREMDQEEAVPQEDVRSEVVSVEEESLADIVDGFKKGVAEVLSPEAYDTHYNLGIAYREMGLVDEAIGEFQLSAKDPQHLVDSCSMLGACFLEKGFPDLAVKWYKRGLEGPDLSEEESLSLLYDLGSVYATSGEREAAYEVFVEIYGVNSHYRDVVARLEELRGD